MNNLKKTYPAYDNWLSKNMVELKKAVAHLPTEETSDIIEVAGRLIWLAAQQQQGYAMVPEEPIDGIDLMICKMVDHRIDCFEADRIYKTIIEESKR